MQYLVAGTIFDTASEAAYATVERYITADGNNGDDEVAEYLAECSDEEILDDMLADGWLTPEGVEGVEWYQIGVERYQVEDAVARFREDHSD